MTTEQELLPRRLKILQFIRQQKSVSFSQIKTRFSTIPSSTLHYDLTQLRASSYVTKQGKTRGVRYIASVLKTKPTLFDSLKIHQL